MTDATKGNQERILAALGKVIANQEKIQSNQGQLAKILANQEGIARTLRQVIANQERIMANQAPKPARAPKT